MYEPSIVIEHKHHQVHAYTVDVVRKLPPLILVDCVAHIRVGAPYGDLTGLGGKRRGLRAELDIELSDEN